MTNTIRRWLDAIVPTSADTSTTLVRKVGVGVAGLAVAGGAIAAPATAAVTTTTAGVTTPVVQQRAPAKKTSSVGFRYQQQPNAYYCGPASTRIALTAQDTTPGQHDLARQLGTTVNGTNSVHDITRVLNTSIGHDAYTAVAMPGERATAAQIAKFRTDAVTAIDSGRVLVPNVVGTATNEDGRVLSFPGGHYITVVGYTDHGQKMKIADPWQPIGDGTYWMSTTDLANWMATRGYTA